MKRSILDFKSARNRQSPFRSSSERTEIEWVGGRLLCPFYITEGTPYRPEMILWIELPEMVVLAFEMVDPKEPSTSLGDKLLEALSAPMIGPPRRPSRIRVSTQDLAVELKAVAPDMPIRVAPTPEVRQVMDSLGKYSETFESPGDAPSYFEDGRIEPEVIESLFDAARMLNKVAPWKVLGDRQVLRVDVPKYGVHGGCLSIIGALEESVGLLLFPSLEGLASFVEAAEQSMEGKAEDAFGPELDLGTEWIAFTLEKASELPKSMHREALQHGWKVDHAGVYPIVLHQDPDGLPRPLMREDVLVIVAVARSLCAFFPKHRALLESEEFEDLEDAVCESYFDEDDVEVRFTVPAYAGELFAVNDPASEKRGRSKSRAGQEAGARDGSFSVFGSGPTTRPHQGSEPATIREPRQGSKPSPVREPRQGSKPSAVREPRPAPSMVTNLPSASTASVGRNGPCPCGSGKKYKQCCLGNRRKSEGAVADAILSAMRPSRQLAPDPDQRRTKDVTDLRSGTGGVQLPFMLDPREDSSETRSVIGKAESVRPPRTSDRRDVRHEPREVSVKAASRNRTRAHDPLEAGSESRKPSGKSTRRPSRTHSSPEARREPPKVSGKQSQPQSPLHDLDRGVVRLLDRFAQQRFGSRYMAAVDGVFREEAGALGLLTHWIYYHQLFDGKPIAQWFQESGAGDWNQRGWIESQFAAWLSVWEVLDVEPGRFLVMEDLLSGEIRTVWETSGSETLTVRSAVLCRVIDHEETSVFCGMYTVALSPGDAAAVTDRILDKLRRKRRVPTARLRDEEIGRFMISCWEDALEDASQRRFRLPALKNTDGDPLLETVDHFMFDIADREEIKRRLAAIKDVDSLDPKDKEQAFVFLRMNPVNASMENTVVGRAIVSGITLRAETNSIRRADSLRRVLEAVLGSLIHHRGREHADPIAELKRRQAAESASSAGSKRKAGPRGQASRDTSSEYVASGDFSSMHASSGIGSPMLRSAEISGTPSSDEIDSMILSMKTRHYATWVDEPLPALRGKTPRDAVKSKVGRDQVTLLLKECEYLEAGLPVGQRYDFSEIRRNLGLES